MALPILVAIFLGACAVSPDEEPDAGPEANGDAIPPAPPILPETGDYFLSQAFATTSCSNPPTDLMLSQDQQKILGMCEKQIDNDPFGQALFNKIFFSCPRAGGNCDEIIPSNEGLNHEDNYSGSFIAKFRNNTSLSIWPNTLVSPFYRYHADDTEGDPALNIFNLDTRQEQNLFIPQLTDEELPADLVDKYGNPVNSGVRMGPIKSIVYQELTQQLFVLTSTSHSLLEPNADGTTKAATPNLLLRYQVGKTGDLELISKDFLQYSFSANNMILANENHLVFVNDWSVSEAMYRRDDSGNLVIDPAGDERILMVDVPLDETNNLMPARIIEVPATIKDALYFANSFILHPLADGKILFGDNSGPTTSQLGILDLANDQPFISELTKISGYVSGIVQLGSKLLLSATTSSFENDVSTFFGISYLLDISQAALPVFSDQQGLIIKPDCNLDTMQELLDINLLSACMTASGKAILLDNKLIIGIPGFLIAHPLNAAGFDGEAKRIKLPGE